MDLQWCDLLWSRGEGEGETEFFLPQILIKRQFNIFKEFSYLEILELDDH